MSNELAFQNTQLSTVNINNQIYLSASELAKALQYADSKSVTKIYNAHADEFTACMTTVADSTTVKGMPYKTRFFSLRGCHLIAMFSRTKVAKEFRKWVLDILDKESGIIISGDLITVNKTNLICLVHHMQWLANFYREKRLYDIFSMLGSDFGIKTHDHILDGDWVAGGFARQLNK